MSSGELIQPCSPSQNTFVCGLYNDSCSSGDSFTMNGAGAITLRPSQVPSSSNSTGGMTISPMTVLDTDAANPSTSNLDTDPNSATFTAIELAGVGLGVGLPLLAGILAAILVILQQRRRLEALETKGSKSESRETSMEYAQPQLQVPSSHASYEAHGLPPPVHGHFREMHMNELDTNTTPQELDPATKLGWR